MLKSAQYKLLMSMYDYNRQNSKLPIIHKGDNTVQLNNTEIASKLGVTSKTVQRLFKTMRDDDLMRTVTDNTQAKRYMVNPAFHVNTTSKYERWFMQCMYHTGSHDVSIVWARLCRYDYKLYDYKSFVFDINTGEVVYDIIRVLLHDEVMHWYDEVHDVKSIVSGAALIEYDLRLSLGKQDTSSKYAKLGVAFKYIDELLQPAKYKFNF